MRRAPTLNQAFVEYAQARGFVVDPARVRSPQDKPRVERTVAFVQGSFWAGEDFGCLAEAQVAAELWCRTRAGLREHGTTHLRPLEVFDAEEAPVLLPAPTERLRPADLQPGQGRTVIITSRSAKALYSVPGDLIGRHVDVRADRRLVKVFFAGQLIKCHARTKAGGRVTDPADLPSDKTDYAMRDIESQKAKAHRRGPRSACSSRRSSTARCPGPGCGRSTPCSAPVTATATTASTRRVSGPSTPSAATSRS